MIRWRLRMLMAEKRISNKELAELSHIHPTSISKLKNLDEIEQISGRVINNLCSALTKAYHARGENRVITPGDLFDYTFDGHHWNPTEVDIQVSVKDVAAGKKSSSSGGTSKSTTTVV
jgi:DNA-binding Xre family transcriptional regulator